MCNKCGNNNCSCPCEECGCQGIKISSDCIEWAGEQLGTIDVNEGDSFTTIITNIENIYNELIQNFETIVNGIEEIERAPGVPVSIPTGTDPIIYVDETNGDLYTWDGSAWILKASGSGGILGVTINPNAGTIVTGATVGSSLIITPTGVGTVFNITPKFTNEAYVSLTPTVSIPVSSLGITFTHNLAVRLRWDGEVEYDGRLVLNGNNFPGGGAGPVATICYGAALAIEVYPIGGLAFKYRPTATSCPNGFKSIPAVIQIIDSVSGVGAGGMVGCEEIPDGLYSYSYLCEIRITNTGAMYIILNDKQFSEDFADRLFAAWNDAIIHFGHVKYYTN